MTIIIISIIKWHLLWVAWRAGKGFLCAAWAMTVTSSAVIARQTLVDPSLGISASRHLGTTARDGQRLFNETWKINIYIYTCILIYISYIYIYTYHIYIYTYIHIYIYTYIHIYIYTYIHIYIYTYIHIYIYTYIHIYIYTYIHIYIYTYIHIYIYTYIHIYSYIHVCLLYLDRNRMKYAYDLW